MALLYHGGGTPTLIALAPPAATDALSALVRGLPPLIPRRVYAHLSPGAVTALTGHFTITAGGPPRKLALTCPDRLAAADPFGEVLSRTDLPHNRAALALYEGLGFTPIAEYGEFGLTAR